MFVSLIVLITQHQNNYNRAMQRSTVAEMTEHDLESKGMWRGNTTREIQLNSILEKYKVQQNSREAMF